MGGADAGGTSVPWAVRVLDAQGSVVGSGLFVGEGHVLTCAHVVAAALGTGVARGRPTGTVRVDLTAVHDERDAEVLPGGWFPPEPDGGDLAVLTLLGPPPGTGPARVREGPAETLPGADVHVLGFPAGHEDGRWAAARLRGPAGRWRELEAAPGSWFDVGYGGAAVTAPATGNVIGMLVGAGDGHAASARMVTARTMAEYWPPLARLTTVRGPDPAAPLPARQAGTLVDALGGISDLGDRKLRALYARIIGERIGDGPPVGLSDDSRGELWTLVTWCAERPGAFQALLAAIRAFHPASVEAEAAAEQIERIAPPPLLTDAERRELLGLVRDSGRSDLAELYREAVGPFGRRPAGDDAPAVVRALENAVAGPAGEHPLTAFVARLAEAVTGAPRRALESWNEAFVRRTGLPRPEPRTPAHAAPAYLVLQIEEDGMDPDRYLVSAWYEQGGSAVTLDRGDEPLTLEDARRRVEETLAAAEARAGGLDDATRIEFILPFELLNAPVDRWRARLGEEPGTPIGDRFPVVVRSLDRLRGSALQSRWRARWEDLEHAPGGVAWAGSGEPEVLSEAIRAGVPALVWVRGRHDPEEAARLRALLDGTRLADLPERIRALRSAARDDRDDPWSARLQLLYDDPRRLREPPDALQEPEPSGETG